MKTPFVPDLNLWHEWHSLRGTLPEKLAGLGLPGVCSLLGVPAWMPRRAWSRELREVTMETVQDAGSKKIIYKTAGREFTALWNRGPDGDWWQTEYPVKQADDLVLFRSLVLDEELTPRPELLDPDPGDPGWSALELPLSPFPRLMLEMLGFSEGPVLLFEAEDEIREILSLAGERYTRQVTKILGENRENSGVRFAYMADNLDASFISPGYFKDFLLETYQKTADILHGSGYELMVHAGGPVGNLLELISQSGIDGIAGICGPPQGDTPFPQARIKAVSGLLLWGGLAQDYLMPSVSEDEFTAAMEMVKSQADDRCIFGIADHVPVEAEWDRIQKAADLFLP